jgi:excisionase family DNA binding protein
MKQVLGINLYTFAEVADLLGVHATSITRYAKEGRLEATTIGKVKYISEQEIKNFVLGKGKKTEEKPE